MPVRIAGVNIPDHKHTNIGLTTIYGVGRSRADAICKKLMINVQTKIMDLQEGDLTKIREELQGNYELEGDLRRRVALDIKHKMEIGCYQGRRHRANLPVRGQRTKTNARTRKGKKRRTNK